MLRLKSVTSLLSSIVVCAICRPFCVQFVCVCVWSESCKRFAAIQRAIVFPFINKQYRLHTEKSIKLFNFMATKTHKTPKCYRMTLCSGHTNGRGKLINNYYFNGCDVIWRIISHSVVAWLHRCSVIAFHLNRNCMSLTAMLGHFVQNKWMNEWMERKRKNRIYNCQIWRWSMK